MPIGRGRWPRPRRPSCGCGWTRSGSCWRDRRGRGWATPSARWRPTRWRPTPRVSCTWPAEKLQGGARSRTDAALEARQRAIEGLVSPVQRIARQGGRQDPGAWSASAARPTGASSSRCGGWRPRTSGCDRDRQPGAGAAFADGARALGRDAAAPGGRAGRHAGALRFRPAGDPGRRRDERLRPDMVVRMPGGRHVVIDAKVPLEGYLQAMEAATDDDRRARMREHAAQVRAHMHKAEQQGLLGRAARHARVRGDVPAGRGHLRRRARGFAGAASKRAWAGGCCWPRRPR